MLNNQKVNLITYMYIYIYVHVYVYKYIQYDTIHKDPAINEGNIGDSQA